jgi:hypothetical protein
MIATGKPANRADGNYRQTLQQVEAPKVWHREIF